MKTRRMAAMFFTALIAGASASVLAAPTQAQLDQLSATLKASMGGGMMHGHTMSAESSDSASDANLKQTGPAMMQGGMAGNDSAACGAAAGGMMNDHMMHGAIMHGAIRGNSMMRGHSMLMPQLPPGNERLQLKMQAEIMQKVGEILSKYADQAVVGKNDAR